MSTKQISRAAVDGRRLRFIFADRTIEGYVVGLDDYHWLVAPYDSDELNLVHKGSASLVVFTAHTLNDEDPATQERVTKVGQAYWDSIKEHR
jgi:hypothetical protein